MMHTARFTLPILLATLFVALVGGCARGPVRDASALPEQRPGDFTLGLVVFGDEGASSPASRSARYIIEPGGEFRASFGAGSDALTYPPFTRMLDEQILESAWDRLRSIQLDQDPWRAVQAPEIDHRDRGSAQGYLLEVRSGVRYQSWTTPIETDSARSLAEWLAQLAWIHD